MFSQDQWELREQSYRFNHTVQVFTSTADSLAECALGRSVYCFQVSSPEMAGRPTHRRIDLKQDAVPGATHRFSTEGWGLVQLYFGFNSPGQGLTPSHANHNSPARAEKWSPLYSDLGGPDEWDWAGVARVSGRLVRFIRKQAVTKHGSRPVLLGADHAVRAGVNLASIW